MATVKLFAADAYQTQFEAAVVACLPVNGQFDVILDQTCFYAEAGGQPSDAGTLGGQSVLAVEIDGDGTIRHRVAAPLSGRVTGEIDWARRLDHMEQHTGQHLLSGAFERLYDAETLSWHLGADRCTVDLEMAEFTGAQVEAIEAEVNRVIRSGLPVLFHLAETEAELSAYPLRKPPKVTEQIRVVEIQGYDWSACAGTHVSNIGELGLLKIKSWEKHKKGVRVDFLVGGRALRDYQSLDLVTREAARALSIGQMELAGWTGRAQEEISGLRKQVKLMQEKLLELEATDLVAGAHVQNGVRIVAEIWAGRPADEVRLLAAKVASVGGAVAVFGTRGAMPNLILYRSTDVRADMGTLLKEALPLIGGKGGGSPVQAQGGGSKPEGLESAMELLVRGVLGQLG
ncbi:MAG TPA: DHHA1 domain-containing protein [Symbiobacteriaceae bacterium]|nr:DHHA1 domain-containing protein [Symbiobacteriaceae bacterium]